MTITIEVAGPDGASAQEHHRLAGCDGDFHRSDAARSACSVHIHDLNLLGIEVAVDLLAAHDSPATGLTFFGFSPRCEEAFLLRAATQAEVHRLAANAESFGAALRTLAQCLPEEQDQTWLNAPGRGVTESLDLRALDQHPVVVDYRRATAGFATAFERTTEDVLRDMDAAAENGATRHIQFLQAQQATWAVALKLLDELANDGNDIPLQCFADEAHETYEEAHAQLLNAWGAFTLPAMSAA